MSVTRVTSDDSLRLGDAVHDWCAAWLTPVRDEAAPAVLAELQTDGTDVVRLGRAELLALRQRCDELLAANPAGEVVEDYPHADDPHELACRLVRGHTFACVAAP